MATHIYDSYGYGPADRRYPSIVGFDDYEAMIATARRAAAHKLDALRGSITRYRIKVYVPGDSYGDSFSGYVTAYFDSEGHVCLT